MDAALMVKMLVQLCQMCIHLWKLHAGICCQHHVDGHPPFQHEQQHGGAVFAARKGYRMKYLLIESNHLVLFFRKQLYLSFRLRLPFRLMPVIFLPFSVSLFKRLPLVAVTVELVITLDRRAAKHIHILLCFYHESA